ncbi:hypothetical protein CRM22_009051 [Opisthorchis felineus]|uniref:Uncharacterized protein n=1 Tax=Opisthorchis felineus TaxID=147828 RepID=A0A4S2LAJ7_OPIFE|nr:hypothetical protein CRM22_009051 [Opisthorchis felineus]
METATLSLPSCLTWSAPNLPPIAYHPFSTNLNPPALLRLNYPVQPLNGVGVFVTLSIAGLAASWLRALIDYRISSPRGKETPCDGMSIFASQTGHLYGIPEVFDKFHPVRWNASHCLK